MAEERKFTVEEMSKYNGRDGNPAYIAYQGKVYDVSQSSFWLDGDHLGVHRAGQDLTAELELAPHGPENIDRMKPVGTLV